MPASPHPYGTSNPWPLALTRLPLDGDTPGMEGEAGNAAGTRPSSPYRAQWKELGGFGRVLVISLVIATGLAIALSLWIPWRVERTLIEVRTETFTNVAADLASRRLVPITDPTPEDLAALQRAVNLRLLGGDAVRVKFWAPDGTIVYSDEEELIGREFAQGDDRRRAFNGQVVVEEPDVTRPENQFERGFGPLIEYYIPIYPLGGDEVAMVFGVYENAERLNSAVTSTRWNVATSMGLALAVLIGTLASLIVANARIITRRAQEAEQLAGQLARAREDERRRVIGALHDDIGQPLYRVLYGIQGARARAEDDRLDAELLRLERLLRGIDADLRSELKHLHDETLHQIRLDDLLERLAQSTEEETGLTVDVHIDEHGRVPGMMQAALVRAAREAITNAWKHAEASRVSLVVRDGDGRVVLEVRDDGKGVSGSPTGIGLSTTKQRLETIGGGMDIRSSASGTLFRAWVPVQLEEEDL